MLSMTGYGRGEATNGDVSLVIEIKTVNNRFRDVNVRLPREYMVLEQRIVAAVKGAVRRGRVDVFVRRSATWVAQPVPWHIPQEDVNVWAELPTDPAPTLTLGAGLMLRMGAESRLYVGHDGPASIVVEGTPTEPVTLSPIDPSERIRGLWLGDELASADIDGLTIERGGWQEACVVVGGVADGIDLSIDGSHFDDCDGAGVSSLDADALRYTSFSGNTFEDTGSAVVMRPDTVSSIQGDQIYLGATTHHEVQPGPFVRDGMWLAHDVPYHVVEDSFRGSIVEVDAVLTLEAGVGLRFDEDGGLHVGENAAGQLLADGLPTEPITFDALGTEWAGIVLYPDADGSRIAHAAITGGGRGIGNPYQGCLSLRQAVTGVSLQDVVFRDCEDGGLGAIDGESEIAAASNLSFQDMDIGLHVHANHIGAFGTATYGNVRANHFIGGHVTNDGLWATQGVPWEAGDSQSIEIEADVTIEGPNVFQYHWVSGQGLGVYIGHDAPGSLTVDGGAGRVAFTSTEASPEPGDWRNMDFGPLTTGGSFDKVDFFYAGRGLRPTIDLGGNVGIDILDVTFTSNAGPDVQ